MYHALFILYKQYNSMAVIWWLDYVNCTCTMFYFINCHKSEAITHCFLRYLYHLKSQVGNRSANRTVFSSVLSIVILFDHSLEKVGRLLLFLICVSKGSHPFRSSVLTIFRSSKTCSIDSQLQHTGKHY